MRAIATIVALMVTSTTQAADIGLHPDVEAALRDAIERGDVRGAVVGVYRDGESAVVGFGETRGSDGRKPDVDTVFEIGSITKVFTALLAQAQVEAGRADWDDSIGEYLPDTDFASPAVSGITLRELASHTSGLPRIPDNMAFEDPLDPYAGYEDDDLLAFLAAMDAETLTKQYDYSNLGAGLLGHVAARIAGASYADAMQRDVLASLSLDDTSVGLRPDYEQRLAIGYSQGADMPNWSAFDALAGAGALLSTVADMLAFVRENLEPDPPAALLAVREPQGNGDTGLGWHINDDDADDPVYWHNGGTGGYASFVAIRPQRGTGVVILSASTEYAAITDLGFAQIGVSETTSATVDPQPYVGAYRLAPGFVLTVFEESGRLQAQATGQAAFPLSEKGPDEFAYPAADIRIEFDRATPGPAQGLTMYQGARTTLAPRVDGAEGPQPRRVIAVDAASLPAYEGRYRLTEGIVITVMARGEQLFAQLTGQQAFPVFAYEPDRFFYKVVDAQLQFERDEQGDVSAVVLHQNGAQRAPRMA